jgi:hypothetical protein
MPPEAWFDLASKRAVVFLAGGYDGSGNYGDIAQIQAAIDLLGALDHDDVALLPVVDLRYLEVHRAGLLEPSPGFDPACVLVYAPPGDYVVGATATAGVVAAALPPSVERAVTYMYGGGFLNRRWGARMLLMLEGVDELTRLAGVPHDLRIASGLQIEPEWAGSVTRDETSALSRFAWLGVRDELSATAARALPVDAAEPVVTNTGDDAVGVIAGAVGAGSPTPGDAVRINLHICPEPWVTDSPDRLLAFEAALVDGFARAAGRRVVLQPVIAYDDAPISERGAIARLAEAAAALGMVERVEDAIVLRPGDLAPVVATMSQAAFTIATSYHVVLTSLLAAIPAVLVRDNEYYAQKVGGLRDDFALSDAYFPSPSAEPAAVAGELHRILDGPESRELRTNLERAAAHVFARRERSRQAILEMLRSELAPGTSQPPRPRAVHVRDWESVIGAAAYAQHRAKEFEALATVRGELLEDVERSMSWRLTAPLRALRRLRARLSRRGGG